jgi:hypothetical protein
MGASLASAIIGVIIVTFKIQKIQTKKSVQ